MLIAWHISQPFLYVMVGYYIYIYHFFSPSFFRGGTPKSHYFFLPPLVDVAGNSSRVMTSRWDSFFLSFHSPILCQRGFGRMNELYVRARTGLDAGLWRARALRSHLLRSIANKISIGIFLKVIFLLYFEPFFFSFWLLYLLAWWHTSCRDGNSLALCCRQLNMTEKEHAEK